MKNLFSKLFKKSVSEESVGIQNLSVDSSQTPEKFQPFKDEVFAFLIDKLQALNNLEREVHYRYEVLQNKRSSPNQTHPDEDGLWKEYAKRSEEIIAPISVKPYESNSRSFGKPAAYDYLGYPDTQFFFIMKSANRAVVETLYEHGLEKKEQFVLKLEDDGWKIESKKYGFPDETTWHKDDL